MPATMLLRRLSSLRRAPTIPRRCFSSSDSDVESPAYRMSMFRRPPTVKLSSLGGFNPNVSGFIGRLVSPVRVFDQDSDRVYTFMEVHRREKKKKPARPVKVWEIDRPEEKKPVRVGLTMRGKIAAQAQRYLQPDDYVYVRGFLGIYEKVDENGKVHFNYKVYVNILNYVQSWECSLKEGNMSTSVALDQQRASSSSESIVAEQDPEEERRERLCLWGIYFANPGEWWDNRKEKKYPKAPDFKHKDTRECLWLRPDDPPWIQKQLQLNDSRMVTGYQGATESRTCLESLWDL